MLALFAWGTSLTQSLKRLNERLRPIKDAEAYANATRKIADSDLAKARAEAQTILGSLSSRKQELEREVDELQAERSQAEATLMMIDEGLQLRSDEAFLLEIGYYEPVYGFEDLSRYAKQLKKIFSITPCRPR